MRDDFIEYSYQKLSSGDLKPLYVYVYALCVTKINFLLLEETVGFLRPG